MSKLQYYTDLELKIKKLESQLERYKSIVKKVDPDNLPRCKVLAFNGKRTLDESELYIDRDCVWAKYSSDSALDDDIYIGFVTHYIEQKDLIKLFEVEMK